MMALVFFRDLIMSFYIKPDFIIRHDSGFR
jgi:hypothetical protein